MTDGVLDRDTFLGQLRAAEAEAARDRAERAKGSREAQELLAREEAKDEAHRGVARGAVQESWAANQAAYEREQDARRAAERAARRQVEDRETDAQLRHDRFPFWADRDRPEPGPTDRPGLIARDTEARRRVVNDRPHRMQGQTRDRGHVWVSDRARRAGRDYPPITRGRGLDEERQR